MAHANAPTTRPRNPRFVGCVVLSWSEHPRILPPTIYVVVTHHTHPLLRHAHPPVYVTWLIREVVWGVDGSRADNSISERDASNIMLLPYSWRRRRSNAPCGKGGNLVTCGRG